MQKAIEIVNHYENARAANLSEWNNYSKELKEQI